MADLSFKTVIRSILSEFNALITDGVTSFPSTIYSGSFPLPAYPSTVIPLAEEVFSSLSSSSLNITGAVYFTATGCPFCLPGFHFGIVFIKRNASASISLSTERSTLESLILPSLSTTNRTVTHPCIPFSLADAG